MKKAIVTIAVPVVAALLVATFATAQPGIGITKTAPLAGTGSSGSPLKITPCASGSAYVSNGTAWSCAVAGDMTGVTAGSGLTGGATSGDATVNVGAGSGILVSADAIAVDPTYIATIGDITSVVAGTGLTGGATSGAATVNLGCGGGLSCNTDDVTLNLATQDCAAGSFFDSNTSTGTFTCVAEVGDISSVVAGSGLINGGTSGAVTVDVQTGTGITITGDAVTLNMTAQTCSAGQHISAATATGTFTCSADSGGVTGSGTTNVLAKFTGSTAIGDSIISESGVNASVNGTLATVGQLSAGTYVQSGTDGVYAGTNSDVYLDPASDAINGMYSSNATATVWANAVGYLGSTTKFRRWGIKDGKGTQIALFDPDTAGDGTGAKLITFNINWELGDATTDTGAIWNKVHYKGTAPSFSGSSCACSIASYSTDARGRVTCTDATAGTGECTITFANGYDTNAPACWVITEKSTTVTSAVTIKTVSTSAFTWFATTAGTHGYAYGCDGML